MTLVKICGLTNLEDARAALAAGADMLGFNFYQRSPRFIEPSHARKIIGQLKSELEHSLPMAVGVVVNGGSAEELLQIVAESGVDAVQLHGDESSELCKELKRIGGDSPFVIKADRKSTRLNSSHIP